MLGVSSTSLLISWILWTLSESLLPFQVPIFSPSGFITAASVSDKQEKCPQLTHAPLCISLLFASHFSPQPCCVQHSDLHFTVHIWLFLFFLQCSSVHTTSILMALLSVIWSVTSQEVWPFLSIMPRVSPLISGFFILCRTENRTEGPSFSVGCTGASHLL